MPIIRVEMFPGRTQDQKRALVSELTNAFVSTAGATPEAVHVVIDEVSPQHWAVGGQFVADR